jgi:hypothetical protein
MRREILWQYIDNQWTRWASRQKTRNIQRNHERHHRNSPQRKDVMAKPTGGIFDSVTRFIRIEDTDVKCAMIAIWGTIRMITFRLCTHATPFIMGYEAEVLNTRG